MNIRVFYIRVHFKKSKKELNSHFKVISKILLEITCIKDYLKEKTTLNQTKEEPQ